MLRHISIIVMATFLSLVASHAFATTTYESTSGSTSDAQATAGSANIFDQRFDSHNEAADLSRSVPNAVAPGLTTTLTETCMGSSSGALSIAGFGLGGGTTWNDEECVRRLDARQLHMLGDVATAREIMCDSELVREAAKRAGNPCQADRGSQPVHAIATPAACTGYGYDNNPGAKRVCQDREMRSGKTIRVL